MRILILICYVAVLGCARAEDATAKVPVTLEGVSEAMLESVQGIVDDQLALAVDTSAGPLGLITRT